MYQRGHGPNHGRTDRAIRVTPKGKIVHATAESACKPALAGLENSTSASTLAWRATMAVTRLSQLCKYLFFNGFFVLKV
jgi:hypothetical protein